MVKERPLIKRYILNDAGEPEICENLEEWAQWMEHGARTVARTNINAEVSVSTVFMGLDHGFYGEEPVLYETMIFGGPNDGGQWRYTTRKEAYAHHQKVVGELMTAAPGHKVVIEQ